MWLGRLWGLRLGAQRGSSFCRRFSAATPDLPATQEETSSQDESCVVANPAHNYILCWHPKQPLRYDQTRPITEEMEKDEGPLRAADLRLLRREAPDEATIEELKKLTFTTKHIWYPKSERRTKLEPKHRKYL